MTLLVRSRICPMKLQNYRRSLVQVWCLASNLESSLRFRVISQWQLDWRVKMVQSSSVYYFFITVPSCHYSSIQKSTNQPQEISEPILCSSSCQRKASLRLWYSQISLQSREAVMTLMRMSSIILDRLNCQNERGSRQREQACLCLRDCSRQGRQKACPHSERTGTIMIQRQMGQQNFQTVVELLIPPLFAKFRGAALRQVFPLGNLQILERTVFLNSLRFMLIFVALSF